jgi:ribosomal protein S18 acetylase RimI-like enzyme
MEDGESSSEDSSDNSLNNLYLRKASSEDVDKIIKIYDKSRDYLDEEDEEWIRSVVSSRSRRIKAYVFKEHEVKAFAIVYKKNDVAYIDALAVDPEYRGRGLGTLFLRSLEIVLRKEGFKKILLT